MSSYYDRYRNFRDNSNIKPIPGIKIPESSSDKLILYRKGLTRLDKVSYEYYNNAYSGWLILSANQEYGGLEFNIPDNTLLRVPFPFDDAVQRYIDQIKLHLTLYGK